MLALPLMIKVMFQKWRYYQPCTKSIHSLRIRCPRSINGGRFLLNCPYSSYISVTSAFIQQTFFWPTGYKVQKDVAPKAKNFYTGVR